MPKIYVEGLGWNVTDEDLRAAFSDYGDVRDAAVMRDSDTGRSKGFGFVDFGVPDAAEKAVASMHDQELNGRRIKVTIANPTRDGGSNSNEGPRF